MLAECVAEGWDTGSLEKESSLQASLEGYGPRWRVARRSRGGARGAGGAGTGRGAPARGGPAEAALEQAVEEGPDSLRGAGRLKPRRRRGGAEGGAGGGEEEG